jgi:hypothetical protein
MRKQLLNKMIIRLRICIAVLIMVIVSLFLFSFTVESIKEDFLKKLGISMNEAERRITGGLLGGSLDHYGIPNLKKILTNDRAGIVKDIATHAKEYANSDAFKKEYASLKENNKPAPMQKVETPEEMRASMIRSAKEFIKTSEDALKTATPQTKPMFEQMLEGAKKNLKDAEDPNNKNIKAYTKNFESMKSYMQQGWENSMKQWEVKYPANHMLYVKGKLQEFMTATEGVDFSAQLYEKNGKKYFVNPDYERKGDRWKMAYRAGKEPVEAARAFVSQWISEIK